LIGRWKQSQGNVRQATRQGRFDSNHLGVREAIQNGTIGKVEMMHLTSRSHEPPPISYIKVSGGQFRDQTIHFFDLACWFVGEAPVEAYAEAAVDSLRMNRPVKISYWQPE
jgi:predicted dehydrogenase